MIICLLWFIGNIEIWIFKVLLVKFSVICLFCGICFLVIFNFVMILICDINNNVICCGSFNMFFNMLLIWNFIVIFLLKDFIWIFDVNFLIVFVKIVFISFIIGVLLLLLSKFLFIGSLLLNE